jgi:DNA polymerase III alpha subunit
VKDGWSESLGKDIDWVDVYSAMNIRDKNQNGTTMEDLVEAGQKTLEKKRKEADAELDKAVAAATKKQEQLEKKGLTAAQSNAAQNPHTVSPRKKTPTKKDKLAEALAQAARNAQLAIDVEARAHLPRPLAGSVEVKTRSHKMNYVVKSIRSSAPDDKFIIFGTTDELGHCTEVLDFFDISS